MAASISLHTIRDSPARYSKNFWNFVETPLLSVTCKRSEGWGREGEREREREGFIVYL